MPAPERPARLPKPVSRDLDERVDEERGADLRHDESRKNVPILLERVAEKRQEEARKAGKQVGDGGLELRKRRVEWQRLVERARSRQRSGAAVVVDGQECAVYKRPVTDLEKQSKSGRMKLVRVDGPGLLCIQLEHVEVQLPDRPFLLHAGQVQEEYAVETLGP